MQNYVKLPEDKSHSNPMKPPFFMVFITIISPFRQHLQQKSAPKTPILAPHWSHTASARRSPTELHGPRRTEPGAVGLRTIFCNIPTK